MGIGLRQTMRGSLFRSLRDLAADEDGAVAAGGGGSPPTITSIVASTQYDVPNFGILKTRDGDPATRWSSNGSDAPTITITLSTAAKLLNIGQTLPQGVPDQAYGQFQLYYADGGSFTLVSGGPYQFEGFIFSYSAGQTKWVDGAVANLPDVGPHTQWRIVPVATMDNTDMSAGRYMSVAEFFFATDTAHSQLITGP